MSEIREALMRRSGLEWSLSTRKMLSLAGSPSPRRLKGESAAFRILSTSWESGVLGRHSFDKNDRLPSARGETRGRGRRLHQYS